MTIHSLTSTLPRLGFARKKIGPSLQTGYAALDIEAVFLDTAL